MGRPIQVKRIRRPDGLVAPNRWPGIHAAWVETINSAADLGRDRDRIADYAADVVETLYTRPDSVDGALTRFGRRLGNEGWTLEQASEWIGWLAEIVMSPPAHLLRSFRAGVALAHGWTEGNLRGMHAEECFDPVTGLCTPAVLKVRLSQVFEQCDAISVEPNWLYRVVIVDANIVGLTALEGDAVMVVLADLVQQHFSAGETISRDGGRIFVLANNTDELPATIADIVAETRVRSLLHAARVLAWIEDLPAVSTQIDGFMTDLCV